MNTLTEAEVFTNAAPAPEPEFRRVALATIELSDTPMQKLRRQRFDKDGLKDLAASVKLHGVMQPVLVRPKYTVRVHQTDITKRWYAEILNSVGNWNTQGTGHDTIKGAEQEADRLRAKLELVAGERRVMASRAAGLTEIPAMVRELTDQQVVEMQVVENNQREGLHELIEAEGFEQLMKVHKLTAEQIAEKVGRSKRYVWNRLKLCELCPEVRDSFYAGKISASVAYLIARISHHNTQREALKQLTDGQDEPPTVSWAHDLIARNYMLMLKDAPFDVADVELLPKAGACGACPKRTGNQKELFQDIKSADVCTDPVCYAAKRDAYLAAKRAEIEAKGGKVITGKAAKEIFPSRYHDSPSGGYVSLENRCWEDATNRTYRQILGKDAPVVVVENPHNNELIELVKQSDIKPMLKAKGIKRETSGGTTRGLSEKERKALEQEREKREIEAEIQRRLFLAIHDKHPGTLARVDLAVIAKAVALDDSAVGDMLADFANADDETYAQQMDRLQAHMKKLETASQADLARFVFIWALYTQGSTPNVHAVAKRLKIDPAKVRKQVIADRKAPPKPEPEAAADAPAAEKKPAAKKKATKK